MTHTISLQEAQLQLSALLALARNGEEIILTEADKPVARLVPMLEEAPAKNGEPPAHILGLHQNGQSWMSEDFNAPLPDEFWLGEA